MNPALRVAIAGGLAAALLWAWAALLWLGALGT